jgi:hypothetical protein
MTFRRASDVIEVNCPSQDSEAHSQLHTQEWTLSLGGEVIPWWWNSLFAPPFFAIVESVHPWGWTKGLTLPQGDKFHPWGPSSPLGAKLTPGGQAHPWGTSSPLGAKFTPGGQFHPWGPSSPLGAISPLGARSEVKNGPLTLASKSSPENKLRA